MCTGEVLRRRVHHDPRAVAKLELPVPLEVLHLHPQVLDAEPAVGSGHEAPLDRRGPPRRLGEDPAEAHLRLGRVGFEAAGRRREATGDLAADGHLADERQLIEANVPIAQHQIEADRIGVTRLSAGAERAAERAGELHGVA